MGSGAASQGGMGGGILDDMTGAVAVVNYEHREVHEGSMFAAWVFDVGVIGSAAVLEMVFKTPAVTSPQKRVHAILMANASVQSVLRIDRIGGTIGGGTSFGEPVNRRDDQPGDSALQLVDGASKMLLNSPGLGTAITGATGPANRWSEQFASKKDSAGAGSRATQEIVLAPNQQYRLYLTSGAASNVAWLGMIWYEHTDSN